MFTGLATVGFGEHYLIDLIVVMPLVVTVQGICATRYKLAAIGLGLVVAWTAYLRAGIEVPGYFNGLAVLATVSWTALMMKPLLMTGSKMPPRLRPDAGRALDGLRLES